MPLMAGATIAAPIVGGLIGNVMGAGDRKAQKKAMKQALAELESVGLPPDLSKEIIFQQFQQVGILTPQLEDDLNSSIAESEVARIKEDPSLRKAQGEALAMMQQRAKVGLSAEDRAGLNQIRSEVQRDAEAKRQQVLQQMQARGMGGSGASLVAQLQAGQDAQNLASQQSDSVMAQAQQRALQALGQSADMASQVREQDFGVNQARSQALDERNRFLAENSIARQSRNVSTLNAAQLQNLEEQQRIADANIQQANAEKLRQVNEQGGLYDRTLGYKQAKANALTGQAGYYGQQAANTAASFGQMGAGIGSAAGAIGSAGKDSAFGKWLGSGASAAPAPSAPAPSAPVPSNMNYTSGKYSGYAANGGIVGDPETTGATAGPDDVNMNLREGEMVLNADQQKGLFEFINRIAKKYK